MTPAAPRDLISPSPNDDDDDDDDDDEEWPNEIFREELKARKAECRLPPSQSHVHREQRRRPRFDVRIRDPPASQCSGSLLEFQGEDQIQSPLCMSEHEDVAHSWF